MVIMRVSVATGQPPVALWRAPYRRTLYEFYHLDQQDRFEDLRARSRAIYAASLMSLAFNEPKRIGDEHRRLLADMGRTVSDDDARANHLALIAEVEQVDRAGGWQ